MLISNEIQAILADCHTSDHVVYLPDRQLDRTTYLAVNKVLESIGGKWNRKAKGHIFSHGDPAALLDNVILTGSVIDLKKEFQFFPTPKGIAEQMCQLAELEPSCKVLEPSCGRGNIADVIYDSGIKELTCVELNCDMGTYLVGKPYHVQLGVDFLTFAKEYTQSPAWDRVIMNPPFSKQQDIEHIMAAYNVLKPGGILVSIVSESPFFRSNAASVKFRRFLDDASAQTIPLDEGAFKESGTSVRTRIIKIRKENNHGA